MSQRSRRAQQHRRLQLTSAAASALAERLAELRVGSGVPALAYSLFNREEEIFSRLDGGRDREAGLPVDEDTLFGVASITKSVTCLAVLQLAAEGALSLDDPITRYLSFGLWNAGQEPTVRQLMNHCSGLPPLPTMTWLRGPTQAGDAITGGDAREVREMAAGRGGRPPDVSGFSGLIAYIDREIEPLGAPGEQFSYSNDGYCLLGAVVSEVAVVRFARFVERRILAPLGMKRSTFSLAEVLADRNHATLYARDEEGKVRRSPAWEDAGVMQGGGALKSTLADLRRYVRFLMEPERAPELGLEADAVLAMSTGTAWCGVDNRYGLGLQETTAPFGGRLVGHGGGLKGVSSQLGWLPEEGVGVVVLTNLGGQPAGLMALAGINALTGVEVSTPLYRPRAYRPRTGEIEPLLGLYRSGEPYGRVRLYRDDDGDLRAAVGSPVEELPAALAGPDELAVSGRWQQQPISVLRHEDGSVRGLFHGLRVLERQE